MFALLKFLFFSNMTHMINIDEVFMKTAGGKVAEKHFTNRKCKKGERRKATTSNTALRAEPNLLASSRQSPTYLTYYNTLCCVICVMSSLE